MRAREGKVLDVTAGYAVASIRFIRRIDIFEAFRASGDPRSSRGRGLRGGGTAWKTERGCWERGCGERRSEVQRVERHGFAHRAGRNARRQMRNISR